MNPARPNLTQGYAREAGMSYYPNLWQNLIAFFSPEMGKTGQFFIDYTRNLVPAPMPTAGSLVTWKDDGKFGGPCIEFGFYNSGYNVNNRGIQFATIGTGQTTFPPNFIGNGSFVRGYTFSFWFKSSDSSQNMQFFLYGQQNNFQDSANYLYFFHSVGSQAMNITGWNGGGGTFTQNANMYNGKWHHMAFVVGPSTTTLYLDGRVNGTQATNNYNLTLPAWMSIGAPGNVGNNVFKMGDFGIWNRALSYNEVLQLYSGASPLTLDVPTIPGLINRTDVPVSTLDAPSSVIAPSIIISSTVSLPTLNAPSSIITPQNVGAIEIINPTTLDAPSSVIAPSVNISSSVSPTTLNAPSSTIAPNILIGHTESIATLQATSTIIAPTVKITESTKFGVKILSINPLLFVSNDSPPKVVNVDTTIPTALEWTMAPISGITTVYDAYINDTNNFIYVAANGGKVVKIEIADLFNQTIFNTGDSNNISTIDGLPLFGLTEAGTDQTTGEIYLIDERNTKIIDSDFQGLSNYSKTLDTDFNLIQATYIDSAFTVLGWNSKYINTDFKCLTNVLDNVTPIKQSQFRVYIDNVEVVDPDLSLDTITITHAIDNESTATFRLNRKHDDINRNLFGTSIPITNQNAVRIEINGHVEFDGKISTLDCQYQTSIEYINVTATMLQPDYQLNQVTIPLPSLNKRLGLYDILVQSPNISNPFVDDRIVIVSTTNEYWTGSAWSLHLSDAAIYGTYAAAQAYIDANGNNTVFMAKNPSVGAPSITPKKYKGIAVNLGTKKTQDYKRYWQVDSGEQNAQKILDGTFNPLQNWTYFWQCRVKKVKTDTPLQAPTVSVNSNTGRPILGVEFNLPSFKLPAFNLSGTGVQTSEIFFNYIGTSLSPVSSQLWILTNAYYSYQRKFDDIVENLGTYTVGSAPFKTISTRNGAFITKFHWEDRADGKYSVKDAGYDYREYAKKVADLEYQKLKNINDSVLPETRCSMNLTIDGYYYYGLKLLTRINVDNTTVANTFNNNNGFPTSIKSISISSSDMKVQLTTDNLKSSIELRLIDNAFPDENSPDYVYPEVVLFEAQKSDMNTRLAVE